MGPLAKQLAVHGTCRVYTGGGAFAGLAAAPHVAAVITNLADDLGLVDRHDPDAPDPERIAHCLDQIAEPIDHLATSPATA